MNGPEGPLPDLDAEGWDRIDWRAGEETVGQLRGRIVMAVQEAQLAYTALRACLSRVRRRAACTVLRGAGRSNALRLPGEINFS